MDSGVGVGRSRAPATDAAGVVRGGTLAVGGPPCPGSWPLQDKTSPVPQHRGQQGSPHLPPILEVARGQGVEAGETTRIRVEALGAEGPAAPRSSQAPGGEGGHGLAGPRPS